MQFLWQIPHVSGQHLDIAIEDGSQIFLVGPNGSGKSALVQHAVASLGTMNVRRISAHRQTWLSSSAINLTPQSRREYDQTIFGRETREYNRWQDRNPEQKVSSVLFDLTAKENDLARKIMRKALEGDQEAIAKIVREERSVFEKLNDLLSLAGFAITIENSEGEAILARRKDSSAVYGIEQMSDGERNAVILAANILTVKKGTILLIDEPERHLHRSIVAPFLSALFELRKDCGFVVSTHDTSLPPVGSDAFTLIVSSCHWQGDQATAWDIKRLRDDSGLPEDLKRAILGARRRVLFVEGTSQSLDIQLYNILFPEVLVVPSGSSEEVITAVSGLRTSDKHHDVEAFGLIDGDNRETEDIDRLRDKGIYALDQYSVESLYYSSDAMEAVANWQAESLDGDASEMLSRAKDNGIRELSREGVPERMSARRCERQIHVQARLKMPKAKEIMSCSTYEIVLDVGEWYEKELSVIKTLLENRDIDALIARYPVRDTAALGKLVNAFDLNLDTYERTLISRVRSDSSLTDRLRSRIGPLSKLLTEKT